MNKYRQIISDIKNIGSDTSKMPFIKNIINNILLVI
jgi:hypothetical protein